MAGAALKSLDHIRPTRKGDRKREEERLQWRIVTVARLNRWKLIYHTRDSRGSQAGFPDLILLRGDRGLAIEVKLEGKEPTDAQREWLDGFALVPGFESFVAKPSNEHELARKLR